MRLSDLEAGEVGGWHRRSALVSWEDSALPPRRLWYEVRPGDAALLATGWEAFVVAAYPLALAFSESRLMVPGSLCPRTFDGLLAYGRVLRAEEGLGPAIELTGGRIPPTPARNAPAACLLSGGVDSLAMLRENLLEYEPDHPGRIRLGVYVFGLNSFDIQDHRPVREREAAYQAMLERLEQFGEAMGLSVLPVRTNVRHLYPDFETWGRAGWTAGTVSAGLILQPALRELWLASNGIAPDPRPRLAQHFNVNLLSSAAVPVHLGQRHVSRFHKTRIVADWPEAHGVLTTCVWYRLPPEGRLNCGKCEKCVRTMLALLAHQRLHLVDAFPRDDLAPADLAVLEDPSTVLPEHYEVCIAPLRAQARHDLADELERIVAAKHRNARRGGALGSRLARALRIR